MYIRLHTDCICWIYAMPLDVWDCILGLEALMCGMTLVLIGICLDGIRDMR